MTLNMTLRTRADAERVQRALDCTSITEAIRRSLAVTAMLAEAAQAGAAVTLHYPDGRKVRMVVIA